MSIILKEVDNSAPGSDVSFEGVPAAVVGTAETGPAFVPQILNNLFSFTETFGAVSNEYWGSVAVKAWYSEARTNAGLIYLRVLGVGNAKKRTTNNIVTNAGFVVGEKQVQTEADKAAYSSIVTLGDIDDNPYANGPTVTTPLTAATLVDALQLSDIRDNTVLTITVPVAAGGDGNAYTIVFNDVDDTGADAQGGNLSSDIGKLRLGVGMSTMFGGGVSNSEAATVAAQVVACINNGTDGAQLTRGNTWAVAGIPGITAAHTENGKITITADTAGMAGNSVSFSQAGGAGHNVVANGANLAGGKNLAESTAAPGRLYFLSTIMSESDGSTYLTDAGLDGAAQPILRAVIMVASGVSLQVSGWQPHGGGDAGGAVLTGSAHAYNTISGSFNAGGNIGAYNPTNKSCKLVFNGMKEQARRVVTYNFSAEDSGYLGGINQDPDLFETAGHYLYAHYPVPSALAVPRTDGASSAGAATVGPSIHNFLQKVDGAATNTRLYHNILLTTGSAARNTYNAGNYKPNFEGWQDRFSTPFTPWIISQPVGGVETKLFRFHALDDGQGSEDKYFVQIDNVRYPNKADEYATFDVIFRKYGTATSNVTQPVPEANSIVKQYQNCTLDPNDDQYIARQIGDYHRYYNFDAGANEQKLVLAGMYENTNKYFRVQVTDDVSNGRIAKDLLPFGHQGMHLLVTSGSSLSDMAQDLFHSECGGQPAAEPPVHTYQLLSSSFFAGGKNPSKDIVMPPTPYRIKIKNTNTSNVVYPWGMRFDRPEKGDLSTNTARTTRISLTGTEFASTDTSDQRVNNGTTMWGSLTPITSTGGAPNGIDAIRSLNKFFPSFASYPMWVGDNAGTARAAGGAILDSNVFNNNKFSLSRVYIAKDANSDVPDQNRWDQARYIRTGVDPSQSGFRFLKATDLVSANVGSVEFTSFLIPFQGGFDGLNIFAENGRKMNHWSAHFEQENDSTQGGLNGSTVAGFRKGIQIMAEKTDVDINCLAVPGQRSTFITDYASTQMEERFDAIYLMDIENTSQFGSGAGNVLFDGSPHTAIDSTSNATTDTFFTISRFAARGTNSSFAAAYYPNVKLTFASQITPGTISGPPQIFDGAPPSIAALAAFAKTARVEGPWGTPAGYTNGRPNAITGTNIALTAQDSKDLTVNAINPIIIVRDGTDPQQISQFDLTVEGTGFINGQRTLLNTTSALSRLDVRKLMIYIRRKTRDIAYNVIFEPNKPAVLSTFSAAVENMLGELVAKEAVQQFRVVIDETTTSQADIENNTVRGKVFVQPYRSVEIIAIDININNTIE